MPQVHIVDYGMGNLASVVNAFDAVGASAVVTRSPSDLDRSTHIVLPGVGAFPDGMSNLKAGGWVDSLNEQVLERRKPFLGLCLGMQLLATTGAEHHSCEGLGWIAGRVVRMVPADSRARVPHMGWNDVTIARNDTLYRGLPDSEVFYFAHSFVFEPDDRSVMTGACDYYGSFAASLEVENIMATQFHPEKSQRAGLEVLRNFIRG